jgi:hypothetical protein
MKVERESVKGGEEGRRKQGELENLRGIYILPEEEGMILSER